MVLPSNSSMLFSRKYNHVLHHGTTPFCTFTWRMGSRTKRDPNEENVFKFVDIKHRREG